MMDEVPDILPLVVKKAGVSRLFTSSDMKPLADTVTYPTSKYFEVIERSNAPTKRPPSPARARSPKRQKRTTKDIPLAPFSLHGVYNLTCPYLTTNWDADYFQQPLILRLAPSSTGGHLWGSFRLGIIEGVFRTTSPAPFTPGTPITFVWRGRETSERRITVDESNEGEFTLSEDGAVRGRLNGAFYEEGQYVDLDTGRCVFEGKKVHDKRYRADNDKLVKGWKKEWRRLPGQSCMIIKGVYNRESPGPSDTSGGEEEENAGSDGVSG